MTGRRLGAVAGAALMIVAALFVRSALDDDDESVATNGGGDLTIACVPELLDLCRGALPGTTVVAHESPADFTGDLDGWVTFEPWPTIGELEGAEIEALASTPLVIAMVKERAEALEPHCGGTINWSCLITSAGQPWAAVGGNELWGDVKVGLPRRTSALGLLFVGEAVAGYFGRTDFFINDFDDAFTPWFTRLRAVADFEDPLGQFVRTFPAAFSAVGATLADTSNGLGQRRAQTEIIAPEPTANAVAVLVPSATGNGVNELAEPLRDALADAEWEALPAAPNLPDPGVLINLRDR